MGSTTKRFSRTERRIVIPVIVQARMSSVRLPGKVLTPVADKPLLQYLLERLQHCPSVGPVIVATSTENSDAPVERLAQSMNVAVYRGSIDDVASRFREIVVRQSLPVFMRISGDSPVLARDVVERACSEFDPHTWDVVTNVFPRTFPPGQSVEVVSAPAFLAAIDRFDVSDREHVTTFFYRNSSEYRIVNFAADQPGRGVRMAVDTEEDLVRFSDVVRRMTRPHWDYDFTELVALYS